VAVGFLDDPAEQIVGIAAHVGGGAIMTTTD